MAAAHAVVCEIEVLATRPFRARFSLGIPADAGGARHVPRPLGPLGVFVLIRVSDQAGVLHYETDRSKAKPKLHPDRPESYVLLRPGERHAETFEVGRRELALPAGRYVVDAAYMNGPYVGPPDDPIGPLSLTCTTSFDM